MQNEITKFLHLEHQIWIKCFFRKNLVNLRGKSGVITLNTCTYRLQSYCYAARNQTALFWLHSSLIFWPKPAFQVNCITITYFSSLLLPLITYQPINITFTVIPSSLHMITVIMASLLLIITALITQLLLIITLLLHQHYPLLLIITVILKSFLYYYWVSNE